MNDITNQELTQYLHRYEQILEQILEQMQYNMFSYMPKKVTLNRILLFPSFIVYKKMALRPDILTKLIKI